MNAWSLLPWNLGPRVDVGSADSRMIVPVTGEAPYPHEGIEEPSGNCFVRRSAVRS